MRAGAAPLLAGVFQHQRFVRVLVSRRFRAERPVQRRVQGARTQVDRRVYQRAGAARVRSERKAASVDPEQRKTYHGHRLRPQVRDRLLGRLVRPVHQTVVHGGRQGRAGQGRLSARPEHQEQCV